MWCHLAQGNCSSSSREYCQLPMTERWWCSWVNILHLHPSNPHPITGNKESSPCFTSGQPERGLLAPGFLQSSGEASIRATVQLLLPPAFYQSQAHPVGNLLHIHLCSKVSFLRNLNKDIYISMYLDIKFVCQVPNGLFIEPLEI